MTVAKPKFAIGQLVHHRLFDYRGVPLVEHFFDSFEDGHYVRNRELN